MNRPGAMLVRNFLFVLALTALCGCASVIRVPFTKEQQAAASIPGIPNARVWSDDRAGALLARARSEVLAGRGGTVNVLAISVGGANGGFGAGLLAGWSERGGRPALSVVTRASSGALIAPFTFL